MPTLCDRIGKTAKNTVSGTYKFVETVKHASVELGRRVFEATFAVVRSVKTSAGKWDCACFGESELARLADLESRQKKIFLQLGEDLFAHEKMGSSPSLEPEKKKSLLEEAQDCDKEIREIKKAMAERKQKMELDATLRRAERDLRSPEVRVRRVAVRILGRIGIPSIIPRLTEILNDPDPDVRTSAAETIHRLVNTAQEPKVTQMVPAPSGPAVETPPGPPPAVATN